MKDENGLEYKEWRMKIDWSIKDEGWRWSVVKKLRIKMIWSLIKDEGLRWIGVTRMKDEDDL